RTAATFVVAVIGRIKLIVGTERERKWIAKTPRHQLQIRPVRMHSINGAARFKFAFHRRQSLFAFAKWREAAREDLAVRVCAHDILGGELFADQSDVARWNVVEFWVTL